jgi:NDP-sugar pyrophosphorylase family protein
MNTDPNALAAIDALILCGGLGTRLRPVIGDRPKGLAEVSGKPVLDILVANLVRQGCRRIIFCVGYMKEQIIEYFQKRTDAEFLFATEEMPLGTGGALRNALPFVSSDPLLVLNGDSMCNVNLVEFLHFHCSHRAAASLVLARPGDRHDGGIVSVDAEFKIKQFMEKPKAVTSPGSFINAGIYLLARESAAVGPPHSTYSLEKEVFPGLVAGGRCYGFPVAGNVMDIGTPERYRQANEGALSTPPQSGS